MLTQQQRQEGLSLAYLLAVAAKAGMAFDPPRRDFGIDGTISQTARRKGRIVPSGVQLDVRLKRSINSTVEEESVIYALEVRAYEILRDVNPRIGIPRILVLFVLPADERKWMEQDEERLILWPGRSVTCKRRCIG